MTGLSGLPAENHRTFMVVIDNLTWIKVARMLGCDDSSQFQSSRMVGMFRMSTFNNQ